MLWEFRTKPWHIPRGWHSGPKAISETDNLSAQHQRNEHIQINHSHLCSFIWCWPCLLLGQSIPSLVFDDKQAHSLINFIGRKKSQVSIMFCEFREETLTHTSSVVIRSWCNIKHIYLVSPKSRQCTDCTLASHLCSCHLCSCSWCWLCFLLGQSVLSLLFENKQAHSGINYLGREMQAKWQKDICKWGWQSPWDPIEK